MEPNEEFEVVEVNGIKYKRTYKKSAPSKLSGKLLSVMSMIAIGMAGMGFNDGGMFEKSHEPERSNVNIPEEYALILEKKSRLSKSQRDWVVSVFKRNYKEVVE